MKQAQDYFRDSQSELKEERKMLLETWLDIERSNGGDQANVSAVKDKMPIKVKKRRPITAAKEDQEAAAVVEGLADADGD